MLSKSSSFPEYRDINGRKVYPGDIIKIYHYRDRRTRRNCYMYKLVVLVTGDLKISKDGTHLYCVEISGIWKQQRLDSAFKCRLESIGSFEIIDGLSRLIDGNLQTWYERSKIKF